MIATCEHLFVYGTLRRQAGGGPAARLAAQAPFVATGTVRGTLYAVGDGSYPGLAVPTQWEDPAGFVHGDLYLVGEDETRLAWIDDYEGINQGLPGSEYRRVVVLAQLPGLAAPVPAWTYEYLRSCDPARQIESGDWLHRSLPTSQT